MLVSPLSAEYQRPSSLTVILRRPRGARPSKDGSTLWHGPGRRPSRPSLRDGTSG
jgi:hypothetical protein